jgi:DNA-binding CsgD family transcriptional regulator
LAEARGTDTFGHEMGDGTTLRGRARERQAIARLLDAVRDGGSRTLVLRGEPGVGKTALLDHAVASAAGVRVVRAAGIETEMELAYAGLHQLCVPLLVHLERLPEPQREALAIAFGLSTGGPPDRFLVGLAALSLLGEAAADRPLLCVIDNAQSVDHASLQTLAFAARRLAEDSVAMLFAGTEEQEELRGLPEIVVPGLRAPDARALLASVITGPLDERVRDRIVAETRGNPLALLELPRGISPAELAGGFRLPAAVPLSRTIQESFRRRFDALPAETRLLSLLAAADPVGESALVWRAAERAGLSPAAAGPATAAGLVDFAARVRFRHPLARSAVYAAATREERQRAHRALADATDPQLDPDRRAWHRAQGAAGTDDAVADELERSAERAQARGGMAAAAAFLERAAELTEDAAGRARRALAAAQAKHRAGAPEPALALVALAESGPLDDLSRARAGLLRGQIAFAARRSTDAPPLLLKAAGQLERLDLRLARDTYLEALVAALYAGRLAVGASPLEAARAARSAPPAPQPAAADLLLDGLTLQITESYAAGVPLLRRAIDAFRTGSVTPEEELRWLWLACHAAILLWDYGSWEVLSRRQVALARDSGALSVLPIALSSRIGVHLNGGDLAAARSLVQELEAITAAAGTRLPPYGAVAVAGWEGRTDAATRLIEAASQDALAGGEGMALTFTEWVTAVILNSLGRHRDALRSAQRADAHPEELWSTLWLHELVEAAVRSGEDQVAGEALERLSAMTQVSGSDWALGIEARSRALLSPAGAAEDLYKEAIDRFTGTPLQVALARSHLLYGEWLTDTGRRADAREQLRRAHDMFASRGIGAFAARAAKGLPGDGAPARRRSLGRGGDLTAQQAEIARLARDGMTNPEIGARLFLSPRTVEYHLHKVFERLGVGSRNELAQVLGAGAGVAG